MPPCRLQVRPGLCLRFLPFFLMSPLLCFSCLPHGAVPDVLLRQCKRSLYSYASSEVVHPVCRAHELLQPTFVDHSRGNGRSLHEAPSFPCHFVCCGRKLIPNVVAVARKFKQGSSRCRSLALFLPEGCALYSLRRGAIASAAYLLSFNTLHFMP